MKRSQFVTDCSQLKWRHVVAFCLLLLAVLFAGFLMGRRYGAGHVETVDEKVVVDTVYIERPQPARVATKTVAVNVPRLLFVESLPQNDNFFASDVDSGNLSEILTGSADSVALLVDVETHVYEDSLYRAQVTGPALGELHPTLDWVEVYSRTHYVTQTVTKRNRFAITAGVGAGYTPQGFQPIVGMQVGVILWSF